MHIDVRKLCCITLIIVFLFLSVCLCYVLLVLYLVCVKLILYSLQFCSVVLHLALHWLDINGCAPCRETFKRVCTQKIANLLHFKNPATACIWGTAHADQNTFTNFLHLQMRLISSLDISLMPAFCKTCIRRSKILTVKNMFEICQQGGICRTKFTLFDILTEQASCWQGNLGISYESTFQKGPPTHKHTYIYPL